MQRGAAVRSVGRQAMVGVGVFDPGGGDVEELLAVRRDGVGEVDDVEDLGAAETGDLHGSHDGHAMTCAAADVRGGSYARAGASTLPAGPVEHVRGSSGDIRNGPWRCGARSHRSTATRGRRVPGGTPAASLTQPVD